MRWSIILGLFEEKALRSRAWEPKQLKPGQEDLSEVGNVSVPHSCKPSLNTAGDGEVFVE